MTTTRQAAETTGHGNAELRQIAVRGFVRDDDDWAAAVEAALRVCLSARPLEEKARAIDTAMMRGIHAAVRCDAIRDLGVQAIDSTNPLRRASWRFVGQHRAARRAGAFNRETAALERQEG